MLKGLSKQNGDCLHVGKNEREINDNIEAAWASGGYVKGTSKN